MFSEINRPARRSWVESLEPRRLFSLPAHLSLAEQLVANILPANNTYAYGTPTVTWAGLSGATTYSNASDCSTFVVSLLEQAYSFTSTQFVNWTGKSLPQAKDLYTAAVADDGFAGFTQIADLEPGDAMFIKFVNITTDTGHCVIADSLPVLVSTSSTQRTYDLTVIDCTGSPHSNDTRVINPATGTQETGVGRGTIHIFTDLNGNLIGYSWGISSQSVEETSSFALTTFAKMPATAAIPWLSAGSLASWNSTSKTLTISGPASIIADPGLSNAVAIAASGSSEPVDFVTPAGGVVHLASINLNGGATAAVIGSSTDPVMLDLSSGTNNISVDSTSQLDLGGNSMIIRGGNLTAINAAITLGYNGGLWTGKGITSSAAAQDSTHLTALGAIQNVSGTAAIYTTFDGLTAYTTDVIVKYTYVGDANLDGKVDGSDYTKIDNGFAAKLTGWLNGDFNYDGVVNGSDYTLMDNAFNTQGTAFPAAQFAATSTKTAAVASAVSVHAAAVFCSTPITLNPSITSTTPATYTDLDDLLEKAMWL